MNKNKIFQSLVLLTIGVALFWFVYKDIDLSEIKNTLSELNFYWISLAVFIGLLSHVVRAVRWQMLIKPMNYEVRTSKLFVSILILYFTNLIIPRGGELARCGVISRYDNIPFVKLFGTVIIERISDFVSFLIILSVVVLWQFQVLLQLFGLPEFDTNNFDFGALLIKLGIAVLILVVVLFILIKTGIYQKFKTKILKIKDDLSEGILSVIQMKNSGLYIVYTFSIYAMWVLMFYFIFFAYEPTSHLTFSVALFSYSVASLAFILPIQAGMGAWHFMVIQCLLLFGIAADDGMIYALVAHTFISLIYLFFGAIAFAVLPLFKVENKN